jgi:hypothetical protein
VGDEPTPLADARRPELLALAPLGHDLRGRSLDRFGRNPDLARSRDQLVVREVFAPMLALERATEDGIDVLPAVPARGHRVAGPGYGRCRRGARDRVRPRGRHSMSGGVGETRTRR